MDRVIINVETNSEQTCELVNWILEKIELRQIGKLQISINGTEVRKGGNDQLDKVGSKERLSEIHTGYNELIKDD